MRMGTSPPRPLRCGWSRLSAKPEARAAAKPVFYHRSAQFRQLLAEVTEDLQHVFCTKHPVLTLAASGTGGMEAAAANCLPPGSKAICLISGRWGERWRNLCKAFGVEPVA